MTDPAERALWQSHAKRLYSVFFNHVLEWPTCSVEWLNGNSEMKYELPDSNVAINKFLLGTCAHNGRPNSIYVADVLLPNRYNMSEYDEEADGLTSSFPKYSGWMNVAAMAMVDGEVNRVKSHPTHPLLTAVKTSVGTTSIFALHRRALFPETHDVIPDLRLRGHRKEGVALEWSPIDENLLASGAEDHNVCVWDIEGNIDDIGTEAAPDALPPLHTFVGHTDAVQDVSWHGTHNYIFASAGDDKQLILWDTRSEKSAQKVEVHRAEVNCCAFHPHATFQIGTCSNDKTTRLWDLRSFRKPVHEFVYHTDIVTRLVWSDFSDTVFATCGNDRQVCIWDVARLDRHAGGQPNAPDELVYVHNGHLSPVSDLTWSPHPNEEWVIASADHTNLFQVWCIKPEIHDDEIGAEVLEAEPV